MHGFSRVAILGTGMIGGSLAAALRARMPQVVRIGFGIEPDISRAMGLGLFQHQAASLAEAVQNADLVVLAAPISVNCALMPDILPHLREDAVLTDVSSVKGPIAAALRQAVAAGTDVAADLSTPENPVFKKGSSVASSSDAASPVGVQTTSGVSSPVAVHAGSGSAVVSSGRVAQAAVSPAFSAVLRHFVASHPIAGSERAGPDAADAALFVDRLVLLSALPESDPQVLARLRDFWLSLGAQIGLMPVDVHDRVYARISHWPHAVAFALAGSVAMDPESAGARAGGGLLDTTRIAASTPALWADILLQNRDEVLGAAQAFRAQLQAIEDALQGGDRDGLATLFEHAAAWRRRY